MDCCNSDICLKGLHNPYFCTQPVNPSHLLPFHALGNTSVSLHYTYSPFLHVLRSLYRLQCRHLECYWRLLALFEINRHHRNNLFKLSANSGSASYTCFSFWTFSSQHYWLETSFIFYFLFKAETPGNNWEVFVYSLSTPQLGGKLT